MTDDPWGLSWRPSQMLRYQNVLSMMERIPQPISNVIDIGCATGDFTYLLSRRQPSFQGLLGVDFVESAVERARRRFPHIHFVAESIFSLGERYERQFDLIVCLEVLYYLDKDQRSHALTSLRRVLRNGGYAVFSSFISKPPYFSPDELSDVVGCNFHVIATQVLHLKMVSFLETFGRRLDKFMSRLSRGRWNSCCTRVLGRLPLSVIVAIEKWSRTFKGFSASHTIVLARANS